MHMQVFRYFFTLIFKLRHVPLKALTTLAFLLAGVHEKNIFTYTSRTELLKLFELGLILPRGCSILEIGSHFGASTVYLALAAKLKAGTVYCVDTWENTAMGNDSYCDTWNTFLNNTRPLSNVIRPIRADSGSFDRSRVKHPVDLVFIDGDHSYEGVKRDYEYCLPLTHANTIIAFHDVNTYRGVSRFFGEILNSTDWCLGGSRESLAWITKAQMMYGD